MNYFCLFAIFGCYLYIWLCDEIVIKGFKLILFIHGYVFPLLSRCGITWRLE